MNRLEIHVDVDHDGTKYWEWVQWDDTHHYGIAYDEAYHLWGIFRNDEIITWDETSGVEGFWWILGTEFNPPSNWEMV